MNSEDEKNNNHNDLNTEEKLVRAWIGENSQDHYINKFKTGGFSFLAFLFPDAMLLGRKMWIEGIVIIVADLLVLYFNHFKPFPPFTVVKLMIGAAYYSIYESSIERKIKRYKKQGLSYEEQLEKAKKNGGDILPFVIILLIIMLVVNFVVRFEEMEESENYNTIDDRYRVEIFEDKEDEGETNYINEFKMDGCTLGYDPEEWRETEITYDEKNQNVIINDNHDVLIYVNQPFVYGNLDDPKFIKLYVDSFKTGMEGALRENYGKHETVDWKIKKNSEGIYLLEFSLSFMKSYVICQQTGENEIKSIAFTLVNNQGIPILPETSEKVEDMLFNIKFDTNDFDEEGNDCIK